MTSTIEVSEQTLRHNVSALQRALADASSPLACPALLAVLKANAYGHGAALCAPMFARAGVPWLGVTDAEEGAIVRGSLAAASSPPAESPEILIMSGPPGDPTEASRVAKLTIGHHLTPVVWTPAQLAPIAAAAQRANAKPHPIHLEIDTGMSRQGTAPGPALDAFLAALAAQPHLRLDGVFTHFASAECADARQTTDQMRLFEQAIATVHAARLAPTWLHLGNSSTIDNAAAAPTIARLQILATASDARCLVRSGLALYGLCLPTAPTASGNSRLRPHLEPVLHWRTTITAIQEVPAGASIGYGATFIAPNPLRLALLPVGYADGLRRSLSSTSPQSGGWVMIRGKRAPIVGRISMNLTTVDVTGIHPGPQPGECVTLLGEGITAEDHAQLAGTLPYEILCGLRGRFLAR